MNVKEFIETLKLFNQDALVKVSVGGSVGVADDIHVQTKDNTLTVIAEHPETASK